jgi:hypothetical protein
MTVERQTGPHRSFPVLPHVPPDSILNRSDVLRALLTASVAIERMMSRAARRAQQPSNVGHSWDKDEEDTLVAAFKSGDSVAAIAARHGRTVRAIEARLEKLGLMSSPEGSTDGSFITSTGERQK